jgi:hypothetical protein
MAVTTVVTNNGEEWIAERIAGVQGSGTNNVAANNGSHGGWGINTGATTAAKADTALNTESTDPAARVATSVTVTGTGSTAKWQATVTLSSTTTQTIKEGGIFSASSAGTMFIRYTDTVGIGLNSGDSIAYTYTLDPS